MVDPLLTAIVAVVTVAGLIVAYNSWRHVTLWALAVSIVSGVLFVLLSPAQARVHTAGLVLAFAAPTILALAFASSTTARHRPWVVPIGVPAIWLIAYLATLTVTVAYGLLSP